MGLIELLKKIFGFHKKEENIQYSHEHQENNELTFEKTIYSLWDLLTFQENTQAFHLINVIGFEEWIDMEEIRRRIKEIFSVEYKNERSLYPYTKTLSDIGFLESINVGGRRKWRKKELLIDIEENKEKEKKKKKIRIKTQ